jgi:hypothetical protein
MLGATIKIFLADGTPLGIRVVDKSGWVGRATDFARSDWVRARVRNDFVKPGVYALTGVIDDGQPRLYVGEADVLVTRINQHFTGPSAKDFWTRGTAFTSKDENLNKAHVKYLESRLVALGLAAKRAKIENAKAPALPSLSEPDRAEADAFLEEMLLIYPILGIDAFTQAPVKADEAGILLLKGKGIQGQGSNTAAGFVVFDGSRASKQVTPTIPSGIVKLREQLINAGVLADDGDALRMTQSYTFTSASAAAEVLLAAAANGLITWKDASGKTLKELQG